jgi:hypothetical protein
MLEEVHDAQMDTIARQSGFDAEAVFRRLAIALLECDGAVAGSKRHPTMRAMS